MMFLRASCCAVFAVHGDVKDWAELALQPQSLADEFFAAGEVLAGGNDREGAFAIKQCFCGVLRHEQDLSHLPFESAGFKRCAAPGAGLSI